MCLSSLMCIPVSLHACTALVFDSLSAHDSERAMAVSIKVVNGERQTKGQPSSHVAVMESHLVCFCLFANPKLYETERRQEMLTANLITH